MTQNAKTLGKSKTIIQPKAQGSRKSGPTVTTHRSWLGPRAWYVCERSFCASFFLLVCLVGFILWLSLCALLSLSSGSCWGAWLQRRRLTHLKLITGTQLTYLKHRSAFQTPPDRCIYSHEIMPTNLTTREPFKHIANSVVFLVSPQTPALSLNPACLPMSPNSSLEPETHLLSQTPLLHCLKPYLCCHFNKFSWFH